MSSDHDDTSDTDDPGQQEKATVSNNDTIADRELTIDKREKRLKTWEKRLKLREGAVTLREQKANSDGISQADTVEYMTMLRDSNAHLVTASIEAQKLTDQVQSAKADLDYLAHHDTLTSLPNRILLQDRLNQTIELAHRQSRKFAVMYVDIDHFKYINDSLGHTVGDQLLQSITRCLIACVRQSDTVSRQGGDEFVILLPSIEHAEDAALSAQKILTAITQSHKIEGHDLHISVSVGICIYPDDGLDAETLIKNADAALFYAKDKGRNNYKFFEQEMNARAVYRQYIEAGLRHALAENEFVMYYQPKINLADGVIVGAEALIRWQHPERGLLLPVDFIAIAEDSGLILSIDHWALTEACRQACAWNQAGLAAMRMAVNASALEFNARDFVAQIQAVLKATELAPQLLELELTESVLMQDAKTTNALLHDLARIGVKLAVDDFGTGFSSLSYLRQFPINTLKIDQSFVKHMTDNLDDAAIVSAVISMAKSLKLCVLAEGVETAEQSAFLKAQHCDQAQGNYYNKPVSADEFAILLKQGLPLGYPA